MARIVVRRATAADLARFSDLANKPSVRAWVADQDGTIIGLGGLALIKGRWHAFCDLTEAVRPHKMLIMRAAKRVMAEARRDGIRFIYAEADVGEPRALAWLTSLGFELDPRSQTFYRWSAKPQWQD